MNHTWPVARNRITAYAFQQNLLLYITSNARLQLHFQSSNHFLKLSKVTTRYNFELKNTDPNASKYVRTTVNAICFEQSHHLSYLLFCWISQLVLSSPVVTFLNAWVDPKRPNCIYVGLFERCHRFVINLFHQFTVFLLKKKHFQ